MIVVRATQKLLKASRVTPDPEPPAPDALLGEWYAHVYGIPIRGRTIVLYQEAGTRLTIPTAGRTLGTTLPEFRIRLGRLLASMDVPEDVVTAELARTGNVSFARTADRSVLGTLTSVADSMWYEVERAGRWDRLDLDQLAGRLSSTPFLSLEPPFADQRLAALLARRGVALSGRLRPLHKAFPW